MPTKKLEYISVVRGTGRFPYDMLRYDECAIHPDDITTAAIEDELSVFEVRIIHLGHKGLTERRWLSFGWHIKNTKRNY